LLLSAPRIDVLKQDHNGRTAHDIAVKGIKDIKESTRMDYDDSRLCTDYKEIVKLLEKVTNMQRTLNHDNPLVQKKRKDNESTKERESIKKQKLEKLYSELKGMENRVSELKKCIESCEQEYAKEGNMDVV
jgi:hypothetical protein